jgi:LPS-assembly protein
VQARWSQDLDADTQTAQLGFHLPIPKTPIELTHYTNYDIKGDSLTESYTGISYESCCWALRFYQERKGYLAGTNKETTYQVQFAFKELASLGSSLENLFQQRITGYTPK